MISVRFVAVVVAASTLSAAAQAQRQAPAQPAVVSGQPTPPRGAARPRSAQVMTLSSSAWQDGGVIPRKHTQAGGEVSPPLEWRDVPEDAVSFVLMVHDLDAVPGNAVDDTLHWMVWDIPGTARSLPEGVPGGPELPDGTRQISATGPAYRGPGAASNGPMHHYAFELFALDTKVDVPAVGASPAQTRAAVEAAMSGHLRGKAAYIGLFRRQ